MGGTTADAELSIEVESIILMNVPKVHHPVKIKNLSGHLFGYCNATYNEDAVVARCCSVERLTC